MLKDDEAPCRAAADAEPAPTQTSTATPSPAPAPAGDYDAYNDGLIEISGLAQLDAMRYDLDGDGSATHPDYAAAFPNTRSGMGCPSAGCRGYELTTDTNSYWDTQTSGQSSSDGGAGKTTRELRSPTANTGIYGTWPPGWRDFGTSRQYPVLKYGGLSVAAQHP